MYFKKKNLFTADFSHLFITMFWEKNIFSPKICDEKVTKFYSAKNIFIKNNSKKRVALFLKREDQNALFVSKKFLSHPKQ